MVVDMNGGVGDTVPREELIVLVRYLSRVVRSFRYAGEGDLRIVLNLLSLTRKSLEKGLNPSAILEGWESEQEEGAE